MRGYPPIKQRYRNYSPKITEYMNKELDELLEAGMVEPSASEWSKPIVIVTKSDGTYLWFIMSSRMWNLKDTSELESRRRSFILSQTQPSNRPSSTGFRGVECWYKRFTALYYWPGIYIDVAIYISISMPTNKN